MDIHRWVYITTQLDLCQRQLTIFHVFNASFLVLKVLSTSNKFKSQEDTQSFVLILLYATNVLCYCKVLFVVVPIILQQCDYNLNAGVDISSERLQTVWLVPHLAAVLLLLRLRSAGKDSAERELQKVSLRQETSFFCEIPFEKYCHCSCDWV